MIDNDIKEIIKSLGIRNIAFTSPKNTRVGNAPILNNGLNLIYAPQGYGKSYTSIEIAKETGLATIYFDLESNGCSFVDYCQKHSVTYIYLGDSSRPLDDIKKITNEIKNKYGKAFIIIDSFSDLFPNDELTMPTESQKALGGLNKFFMRTAEMPVLLLDHATENKENNSGYKIEGNKSGKFKKTLAVLRLDKIDKNIENGTYITIERSRDHDALRVGHTQNYERNSFMKNKLSKLIKESKIPQEFSDKDIKNHFNGDGMTQWRNMRDDIATSRKDGRTTYWTLNK